MIVFKGGLMLLKLKMHNKIEEIRTDIERKYDQYLNSQKEYYNLQFRLTKGELVWQILNGSEASEKYYKNANVNEELAFARKIKNRIDAFHEQYLNSEDKQLYIQGMLTADLDLLYKSYQKGNMDAAFIWGVVMLQNGNRLSEAIDVLKMLIDQNNSYSMDSMLALAEYHEIYGLTEAKDVDEAQDYLKLSLRYYKEMIRKGYEVPIQYKDRVNNIESILDCYNRKLKAERKIRKLQNRSRIKNLVGGLLFNIIAVPFAVVLTLTFITTCKHAIEIEVAAFDIDMIIRKSGNIIYEDQYAISLSDKLPYLRGDYIPAILPIGIEDSLFQHATYIVKDGITKVPIHLTEYANNVSHIELPDSVVNISESAFFHWSSLETINLPSSIQSIGDAAFAGTNIKNFTWPEHITELPPYIFRECESLENIELPNTVISIGNGAFSKCPNLRNIELPDSITRINDFAFWKSGIENIVIPENVSYIGKYAFNDCSELRTVKLPEHLTEINESTFKRCGKLVEINLPENLEVIFRYAFSECTSLTSITLPEKIKTIEEGAFSDTGLKSITLPYGIKIGGFNFNGLKTIYVDSREYEQYKDHFVSFAEVKIKD